MKVALGIYQIGICLFCLPPILMFQGLIGVDYFFLSIIIFSLITGIALFLTKLLGLYLMLIAQLLQVSSFSIKGIEYLNAQGLIFGFKISRKPEIPEESFIIESLGIIGGGAYLGPTTDSSLLFSVNATAIVLIFVCLWLIKKGANQPAQVNPCNPPENPRIT